MIRPNLAARRAGAILAALLIGIAGAAAQGYPPAPPTIPAPQTEVVPVAPPGVWVWQPGHWRWNGYQYVWRPGRYVHPHPHALWIEGHWVLRHRGWVWVPGHWR